jgi:O-antigen/teichoic acid export membrane protein
MFFLGAISEPLLYCLIGPKWHEAAIYLPLICISGSLYPLHAINLNMLQVQGRSDLFLGLEVIKKIIGIAPLSVCIFYGILPMLYTSILISIIAYFLNSYYSGKFLGYSSWTQAKDIAPSYGLATLVALSIFFLKYLPISYWIILPIQIILGCVILLCVCQMTKIEEYMELKRMVEPYLKKVKR